MGTLRNEESGYRLRLEYLGPHFEYKEEPLEAEEAGEASVDVTEEQAGPRDHGARPQSHFTLYNTAEFLARRLNSWSWPLWNNGYASRVRYRRVPKKREWGLVVFVFGPKEARGPEELRQETAAINPRASVIYWHPVIWCAAHPCRCGSDASLDVFLEYASVDSGIRYDEFISTNSRYSTMVPNIPHKTHFPVQER